LVSVLAYGGLRPSEALGLRWQNVGDRTILVEGGVVLGEERDTKTRRARTIRLLSPLAQDLREWRMALGRPSDRELVFPRRDGQPWRDMDYRNWRKRVYRPAAAKAGIEQPQPYDLRHSFVSLLIHEGVPVLEVARQAGHSATVCLSTYAHVFEEFDPSERTNAEEAIRAARDELVPDSYPTGGSQPQAARSKSPANLRADGRIRTHDPRLRERCGASGRVIVRGRRALSSAVCREFAA